MGSVISAIVGALLLASVASAAEGAGTENQSAPVSACHPAGELAAAKAALARGDREAALELLRQADAALAECERSRMTPVPGPESADHMQAHAAGAANRAS
jgi:hypothetical protein